MVFLGKGDFLCEVSTGRQFRMLKLHRLNALRKTKLQLLQVLHCFPVGFCYLILFNAFSWLYFNLRLSFQRLTANQENPSLNYRYYVKHLLTISKLMGVKTQRKTFFDFLNFSSLWSNWHLLLFDFFSIWTALPQMIKIFYTEAFCAQTIFRPAFPGSQFQSWRIP